MSSSVTCLETGSQSSATDTRPETTQLEAIAEQVRRDSQVDSQEYLQESLVPHGGE
jgi:hypothetical protein